MSCDYKTVHTPDSCNQASPMQCDTHHEGQCSPLNTMRLYTLRCGTWVYSGQMSINSTPQHGMRIIWEDKSYSIEQATLVGSEPGIDKWEVMLIQAGPQYMTGIQQGTPCMPCQPAVLPPIETPGGVYVENPSCSSNSYPPPSPNYPYNPLPVEQGLGCGPHYTCNGYPH